ncbi:NADH dehydrogenase [Arachidicoccus ginsenosidimutans]|uniref:NADH-quinone oxidoreductase subunit N n=1 Tax=Arachidicoccus sp. BS20 TaxID=1850526 RepID=UPI0007F08430|nr:NADH-quinone oxidoreductase subunit N [Arachidicoccus sp. BS20]ANI90200.1 NADH dehydrogenase [Arachidicoccus sp. BS20]
MNAIILSAILGVVMMFCSAFVKNTKSYKFVALVGLVVLLLANICETYGQPAFQIPLHDMLKFDKFGLYFNSLAIICTFVYVLLSGKEIEHVGNYVAEYFALIFFVLCGVFVLTSFNNLLMLFIGIEILSIPLYILTGSRKLNLKSNEAALKYFLMGSFSTGLMLMGIALIYGGTGSFAIHAMAEKAEFSGAAHSMSFLTVAGALLLLVSMCFKVSAAPFHFWTPDVYDGSPSVFTSFMATVVKSAAFIAFIRLFVELEPQTVVDANKIFGVDWKLVFAIIIIATLVFGNITAVFQQSVKRMLAYSSIAQAGFMLFALLTQNTTSQEGILLYAIAYSFATIGIFSILAKLQDYTFDGYNGLAKTQPALAFANTIFLLSLAGIPLTAGFFAKYYMISSVMQTAGFMWLAIVGMIFAAISVYYYFRVIQAMYFKDGTPAFKFEVSKTFKILVVALAIVIILIGIFPQIVLNYLYF